MNTIDLARKLNLVETIVLKPKSDVEQFNFLFVLDFEATCWDKSDRNSHLNEIIEFSVVLYDLKLQKILSEFQQYVSPTEAPKLSSFCTSLTGITQQQVDSGVRLGVCLTKFEQWFKENSKIYKIVPHSTSSAMEDTKNGTFVTWTSWDLGTCLNDECERKDIPKSNIFNAWIDLKQLYEEHYGRKRRTQGLAVALNVLGLKFVGNQHCGLDDARNTAYLAGSMSGTGIAFRITHRCD